MIVATRKWINPYPVSRVYLDPKKATLWILQCVQKGHKLIGHKILDNRHIVTIEWNPNIR